MSDAASEIARKVASDIANVVLFTFVAGATLAILGGLWYLEHVRFCK